MKRLTILIFLLAFYTNYGQSSLGEIHFFIRDHISYNGVKA